MNIASTSLVLALGASCLLGSSVKAEVLYREVFGLAAADANLGAYGWTHLINNGNAEDATSYTNFITSDIGSPADLAAVNSNATNAEQARGYYRNFFGGSFWEGVTLLYTTEHSVDRSQFTIDSLSWVQASATYPVRAAVRIGADWFVSEQTFVGGTNAFFLEGGEPHAVLSTLDFSTATWRTLSFAAGSAPIVMGDVTVTLSSGDLTGFGVFLADGFAGADFAFDTFTVQGTAIPEPGSAAALLGVCATGCALLRRRRSR